jgi:hypothetical protein
MSAFGTALITEPALSSRQEKRTLAVAFALVLSIRESREGKA